jgi:hypothetical protein
MGRKKIAQVREIASVLGWLVPDSAMPDEQVLAALLARKEALPPSCIYQPWNHGVSKSRSGAQQVSKAPRFHATLARNHGYTSSYSSVYRFLHQLHALQVPDVPLRLEFRPAEAAQVDFGAGPLLTDVHTGEVFKTWFFVFRLNLTRSKIIK